MSSNRRPDSSFAPADKKGRVQTEVLNTLPTTPLEDGTSEELEFDEYGYKLFTRVCSVCVFE